MSRHSYLQTPGPNSNDRQERPEIQEVQPATQTNEGGDAAPTFGHRLACCHPRHPGSVGLFPVSGAADRLGHACSDRFLRECAFRGPESENAFADLQRITRLQHGL